MDNFYFQKKIKKLNFNKIFYPTDTSRLLINIAKKYLKKKQKILDLGCGGGVVTYFLYNRQLYQDFYLSDISGLAIIRAKANLKKKINATFCEGNLFKPWSGKKFDLIINDVSGVSSEIVKISNWFNYAPSDKTKSGIGLLKKVILQSKNYLYSNSLIILPIISLSNVRSALNFIKKKLHVVQIKKFYWPMPEYLIKKIGIMEKLKKKGFVDFEKKYGTLVCYTLIVVCKKNVYKRIKK
jgi:methylase of polypeptide subunit release factors